MKKIILVSLLLIMTFAVAGCGNKKTCNPQYNVVDGVGVYQIKDYSAGGYRFYATKQDYIDKECK